MEQIQWYPGHMTKARRMIIENLKLIDAVVEIVDARAPFSTRNPDFDDLFAGKPRFIVLNKSDLAAEKATKQWQSWYENQGFAAIPFVATGMKGAKAVELIGKAVAEKALRQKQKGITMLTRALVAGIPNVGKSTFINCLSGGANAKTGDRPGVTKGKQWIHVSSHLELMDTPGLLWPKIESQDQAERLAFIGSIRGEILDSQELCQKLLAWLQANHFEPLCQRYKKIERETPAESLLEAVAASRGFLQPGGVLDTDRAANVVLDEFRSGKIARVTLESPADVPGQGEDA